MATYSGAGRVREPGEIWYEQLKNADSLDDSGYVLAYTTESSVVKLTKAGSSDLGVAVNYRSSRDPHDLNFPPATYKTGTDIGEMGIPVIDEGWVRLKVANNNAAISIGDPIKISAGGKVDKYTATTIGDTSSANQATALNARFTELRKVVGIAKEAVAAGSGSAPGQDKVLVKLTLGTVGTQ